MPCPIKPPPKRKIKQEDDSYEEVDDKVELEICKEQIELIARQERECATKLGQTCHVTWGQCTQMSQNKTKVHDQHEEAERTDNPIVSLKIVCSVDFNF